MLGQQINGSSRLEEINSTFLSHIYQKSKVLLLYDNVNDYDLLSLVLPRQSSHVHVLVTTRSSADHEVLQIADSLITLDSLSCNDALTALFGWADRARPVDEDELEYAKRLVTNPLIHGLPLAIAHIGTFLRQTNMSCCNYYQHLKSREDEMKAAALNIDKLLEYFHISHLRASLAQVGVYQPEQLETLQPEMISFITKNPYDTQTLLFAQVWMKEANYVYLTWQFDIESVMKKNPDAMRVLEFACLLSSSNIFLDILQSMVFPDRDRLTPYRFSLCLTELSSHTLINIFETNGINRCDVHSLVQLTVLQRLVRQPDRLNDKLKHLSRYLLQNIPNDLKDISKTLYESKCFELVPHLYSVAEKIVTVKCDDEECLELVMVACLTALDAGHVDVAYRLCEKNLDMIESLCSDLKVNEYQRDKDSALVHVLGR